MGPVVGLVAMEDPRQLPAWQERPLSPQDLALGRLMVKTQFEEWRTGLCRQKPLGWLPSLEDSFLEGYKTGWEAGCAELQHRIGIWAEEKERDRQTILGQQHHWQGRFREAIRDLEVAEKIADMH